MRATVVVETCNLMEGQSYERLTDALAAAVAAASGASGGPHEVLLVDASGDARTDALVAGQAMAVQHVRVPVGTGYDVVKDLAAATATTEAVAYLDGDCIPAGDPAGWLEALLATLERTGAPGVAGTTAYDGWAPYALASSALDFGFLVDEVGGPLGCYVSNNVAFLREERVGKPCHLDGLRCACFLHAQRFVRQGRPMRHAGDRAAFVRHELPGLFYERLRRGYDEVAVGWLDPDLPGADQFTGVTRRTAPKALARYWWRSLPRDRRRLRAMRRYTGDGPVTTAAATALLPLLRMLDVVGAARAIYLGPDAKWSTGITVADAAAAATTRSA